MSIKRKAIIVIAAMCIVLASLGTAFASTNSARLLETQKWKFSPTEFKATKAFIISGSNSKASKHSVYYINVYYKTAGAEKSTYTPDTKRLIAPNRSVGTSIKSTALAPQVYFRLLLNPYGDSTTGCMASGTQANYNN